MGCGGSKGAKGDQNSRKRLLEEYSVGATLGEGAFGVVYACVNRQTGEEVAVKMVDKVETPVEAIRKEAEMLKSLNHPNIVRFHQVFFERCFVCIVMDKYTGGDLVEGLHLHLKEKGKIACQDIVHVSAQMADGIRFLHSKMIAHRDVKGDNFLMDRKNIVDPKCKIALTDFGTAVNMKPNERLSAEVGTRIFWAPETFTKNYGLKVDVWAMGIIMYGLIDGRFPFKDENDIKKKEVKIPKRVHPSCEDYIRQMLQKEEAKRISAEDIMVHPWITSGGKMDGGGGGGGQQDAAGGEEEDTGGGNAMREVNVNEGIKDRRNELIDRLQEEHQGKSNKSKKKSSNSQHYWAQWFTIVDKHAAGSTLKFEWWDNNKVTSSGILKMEGVAIASADAKGDQNKESLGVFANMLKEHGIDPNKFGKGQAKTLEQMSGEVHSGAARLMLDATEHKKLVRVVDIVLLRLVTPKQGKILVESAEMYPDGRKRQMHRLPGTKKEPHENAKETTDRILKDMLNMGNIKVEFDFDEKEVFEEETESPSYPGVRTVYRKEIVQGSVVTTDTALLNKIGLPACKEWSAEDTSKNTKFFVWLTEKEAVQKHRVKLKAEGSEEVSGLVMAPIGMQEDDLKTYLEGCKVDVGRFGQEHAKTLKEFSTELIKGESALMQDANNAVLRVVDIVIMKIMNPVTKDLLVQTEQDYPDGTKVTLNRLPGAKRRPDENQFLTARRILRKQLKIDENQVCLSRDVQFFEEEKPSVSYPGLRTVYRKRVITAELLVNSNDRKK
eukprot:gnl/TRDRNA2_/TRDRNA2_166350_c0_seq2.p1 gnl/TRDRNA2_/TRDRNA2_166350_c0~~gnl/TRDRNA2_/TRDRNA2_166350_c0_seq2.p1  ORF type:complete len:778 (+),score=217.81 gnl/TRDRNA2_/TRDRNA2_166350_c0_seq2:90-2423(+)